MRFPARANVAISDPELANCEIVSVPGYLHLLFLVLSTSGPLQDKSQSHRNSPPCLPSRPKHIKQTVCKHSPSTALTTKSGPSCAPILMLPKRAGVAALRLAAEMVPLKPNTVTLRADQRSTGIFLRGVEGRETGHRRVVTSITSVAPVDQPETRRCLVTNHRSSM